MTNIVDENESVPAKSSRRRRTLLALVLVASAAFMLNLLSMVDNWKRDLTTNVATLDPQSGDPLLRPPKISRSPEEVAAAIRSWTQSQPRWSMVSSEETDSGLLIHLTHTTAWLKFTDDVHVRLQRVGEVTRVSAESRSRWGKGDLGQNPRNLRQLVRALQNDL